MAVTGCDNSSVANPICREGQSERTFPIFVFSFRFFLFFPDFSWFFPLFSRFLANFSLSGVALCPPLPPQWLRHCVIIKMYYLESNTMVRFVGLWLQTVMPQIQGSFKREPGLFLTTAQAKDHHRAVVTISSSPTYMVQHYYASTIMIMFLYEGRRLAWPSNFNTMVLTHAQKS